MTAREFGEALGGVMPTASTSVEAVAVVAPRRSGTGLYLLIGAVGAVVMTLIRGD